MKRHNRWIFVLAVASLVLLCFAFYTGRPANPSRVLGEPIARLRSERVAIPRQEKKPPWSYPWEDGTAAEVPKITKDFFRCKGSVLNPERVVTENGKTSRYADCGGFEKHSLPLREQKEFIYPVLLNLLNHVQNATGKRVVITSGHRCPAHNAYVDPSKQNVFSKHTLGAEVSFYVLGMEDRPLQVVEILKDYYRSNSRYQEQPEFLQFQRYEKEDTNVSTLPWFNKEVFIKYFKSNEGRDFDNRHPYPYISIQVRYDIDKGERVLYSWEAANKNILQR